MMKIRLSTCIVLALSSVAMAEVEFHVGGFGTLGIMHSSNKKADYGSITQSNGTGFTHNIDTETNTLGALQLDTKFNDQWSAIVQAMTQKNDGHNDFSPHFEWANIKYKPTAQLSFNVGRMVIPAFMASDYRLVNYANLWEHAPLEVYNLTPVSHGDGLSMMYKTDMGKGMLTLQGMYLNAKAYTSQKDLVNVKDIKYLSATYEIGDLTLRALECTTQIDFTASPQLQLLRPALNNAGGAAVNDRWFADSFSGGYSSIGMIYDPGKWVIQGEYVYRKTDRGVVATANAGYIIGGVRIGKYTPFAMFARRKDKGPFNDPYASFLASGATGPQAAQLGAITNSVIARFDQSQTTSSIGVRYDIAPNLAIKAQYDHIRPDQGSYGVYIYPATQSTPAGHTNLVSINLDFMF